MKIVTILGARPQFIKAGSVSRAIAQHEGLNEIIVHTGQHYDANMSDIFFQEMQIPQPDYHLDVNGLSHGAMTGQMLEKIEQVLIKEKPDWVLVYGDTNSTLAGALAAKKLHIKLAHVEAGLRSYNQKMPEEINRILTDRISDVLFCPTDQAITNLADEGYEKMDCSIVKSGDVMLDGAQFYRNLSLQPDFQLAENFILCTVHRAENTDNLNRLRSIIDALNVINEQQQVVMPVHPRTKAIMKKNAINADFTIVDPVGYLQMVYLISHSQMVMTDSGGLQKEAFFFHKPCITLRDETEWQELISHRYNVLAGAGKEKILALYDHHSFNDDFSIDLYGQGQASEIIIKSIVEHS